MNREDEVRGLIATVKSLKNRLGLKRKLDQDKENIDQKKISKIN